MWPGNLAVLALAGVALGIGVHHYLPFLADDSLISLRYAERLVDGHGLTWTNGTPVEGYSNLLWVLLLSAAHALGADLVVAARVLGVASALGAIAVVVWWSRSAGRRSIVPGVAAGVGMALTGPLVVWAIGGLEQPLLAVLLSGATVLVLGQLGRTDPSLRTLLYAGTLYGLLCLTRPDGLIVPAVACVFLLVANWRGSRWKAPLTLGVVPAICVIGQEIFRLAYYRSWVPNTAYAKVADKWTRVVEGFHYVVNGHWTLLGLFVPAAAIFVIALVPRANVDAARRQRVLFLALAWITWSAYVTFIGGDIFPAYRHLTECVVLLALLSVEFWQFVVEREARPRVPWLRTAAIWMGVAVSLMSLGLGQVRSSQNKRAITERWEWDCQVIGLTLKSAFQGTQPLFAVDPAGCAPYFSQLPALDMMGLNDSYLAHHRPPGFGTGQLGHELGSGPYVLGRQPDLVLMCSPYGSPTGCYRSGTELVAAPEFQRDYRPVQFYGTHPHGVASLIWVRTASPRVGVHTENGAIVVPGYLAAVAGSHAWALIPDRHGLAAGIQANDPVTLRGITVPAGTWHLDVSSSRPVQVSVETSDGAAAPTLPNGDFRLAAPDSVSFVVRANQPTYLRQLTLRPARP